MTTVLVTGASPGSLGEAVADGLRQSGADVVVTSRSGVVGSQLDLASFESVEAFCAWYAKEVGQLDVLVNNAGVHLDLRSKWKEPHIVDGHEIHWRTNYLGTWHLTDRLLPLLLQGKEPRVVNVVSKLHARGRLDDDGSYNSWVAYGTSKLALIHHAKELSRRHPNVVATSLHPGSVYTHIADRGLEEQRVLSVLRKAFAPLERRTLLSPEQGAQTVLHCASADVVPGGYYERCALKEPSAAAQDSAAAERLWDETARWLATRAAGGAGSAR